MEHPCDRLLCSLYVFKENFWPWKCANYIKIQDSQLHGSIILVVIKHMHIYTCRKKEWNLSIWEWCGMMVDFLI